MMDDKTNSHVGKTQAGNQDKDFNKNEYLSYDALPYEDPAITNPAELASFPKPAPKMDAEDIENENTVHMVNNKRHSVREGRNIISTDNNPERNGFM